MIFEYKVIDNDIMRGYYSNLNSIMTTLEFFTIVEDILDNNSHLTEEQLNTLFQKKMRQKIVQVLEKELKLVVKRDYFILTDFLYLECVQHRPMFYDVMKIGFIWGIAFMSSKAENKFKLAHPEEYNVRQLTTLLHTTSKPANLFSRHKIQEYIKNYHKEAVK